MTRNGSVVLLLLTVAAIGVGALVAERRGWIRGELDFSKMGGRASGAADERGDAK